MYLPNEIIEHILSFNRFHRQELNVVLNQLKYLTDKYYEEFKTSSGMTNVNNIDNGYYTNFAINNEIISNVISLEVNNIINQHIENNMRRFNISRKPITSVSDYILEKNNQKQLCYNSNTIL
jgi:hypothetical protein|tara:strand:- start:3379 stop:3744 length:366 start_codon:yes stop_codon:yes gene_type:complete